MSINDIRVSTVISHGGRCGGEESAAYTGWTGRCGGGRDRRPSRRQHPDFFFLI